jgi:hypothetical protein
VLADDQFIGCLVEGFECFVSTVRGTLLHDGTILFWLHKTGPAGLTSNTEAGIIQTDRFYGDVTVAEIHPNWQCHWS